MIIWFWKGLGMLLIIISYCIDCKYRLRVGYIESCKEDGNRRKIVKRL